MTTLPVTVTLPAVLGSWMGKVRLLFELALLCVTAALAPPQLWLLACVDKPLEATLCENDANDAPPVNLTLKPLNVLPDSVTPTTLPAAADDGAVTDPDGELAWLPWPGVPQLPAPWLYPSTPARHAHASSAAAFMGLRGVAARDPGFVEFSNLCLCWYLLQL